MCQRGLTDGAGLSLREDGGGLLFSWFIACPMDKLKTSVERVGDGLSKKKDV